jgi:3-phenylpropionate/trans-cinnamate dioxygenase ferredoxin reductase component
MQFRYVLLGGGVASVTAAMGIREHDKEGSIAIVRDEPTAPYDRPPLSKGFLRIPEMGLDDVSSKFDSFYPDNGIELITGRTALKLDRASKTLELDSGETVGYEKLLFATGERAAIPRVSGVDLPGVFPLRSIAHAEAIREALTTANSVLIVGAGYMALELAGTCLKMGKKVTIVAQDTHPWSLFASPTTGAFLIAYFVKLGITWHLGTTLTTIEPGLQATTLSGETIPADVILLATGGIPNGELAADAGLAMSGASVVTDEFLQTSDPNVWAAGDVAHLHDLALGCSWCAEHHLHAKWTGQAAGANMAGANEPYDKVAYFWSDFHEHHMILRGLPGPNAVTRVIGDPASGNYVELYGDATGALRMGIALHADEPKLDPISDRLAELIRARVQVDSVDGFEL